MHTLHINLHFCDLFLCVVRFYYYFCILLDAVTISNEEKSYKKMTLHIFNPEHDLALASGLTHFTAPHAGRQLRHDLGWLPALWAEEGDAVLVDDVALAQRATRRRHVATRLFVDKREVASLPLNRVDAWGWNAALRNQLLRCGVDEALLPSADMVDGIRQLSHRRTAASLLPLLQEDCTLGEAVECSTMEETAAWVGRYGRAVIKAPWSSSGRGIRFITSERHERQLPMSSAPSMDGWLRNVLLRQGTVMVEPYYDKAKDFGMEFYSDGQGHVEYLGLSLFHTANGAYTGKILATEQAKRKMLGRYLQMTLIDGMQARLCSELGRLCCGKYCGPLGVDMMVCCTHEKMNDKGGTMSGFLLHPCVEINLRRTMGHVALALAPTDDDILRVMRTEYTGNCYKLTIKNLGLLA